MRYLFLFIFSVSVLKAQKPAEVKYLGNGKITIDGKPRPAGIPLSLVIKRQHSKELNKTLFRYQRRKWLMLIPASVSAYGFSQSRSTDPLLQAETNLPMLGLGVLGSGLSIILATGSHRRLENLITEYNLHLKELEAQKRYQKPN